MSARFVTLALALGAVALGSCGASSGHAGTTSDARPDSAKCHPRHAHTLAADREVRVFSLAGAVYGCVEQTGKRYKLGQATTCIGTPRAGPASVAAELAAYGLESCGVDTGFTEVVVRRLSDGKRLLSEPATTNPLGPESYESVDSLVLRSDGAVAWIAVGSSIVGHTKDIEVHRASKHGHALLDSGANIDPSSLRLHRSVLTWTHGRATRSAELQ